VNVPGRNVRILRGFGKAEEIIGHCHESEEAAQTRNRETERSRWFSIGCSKIFPLRKD
jgi:hypothetical protein